MIQSSDQLGRLVSLPSPAKRIISLVPSITEMLFDLGCSDEVVGITKFCFHPDEWFRTKTRIGGTKTFHLDKIAALNPDLIIANKEENDEQFVKSLMPDYTVWVSDVKNEKDAIELIEKVGELVDKKSQALSYKIKIEKTLLDFTQLNRQYKKVAYLIWQDPIMVCGGDTYINSMLQLCGWHNCFQNQDRYPTVTKDDLATAQPELLLLSSEPFPFAEKHIEFFQEICPNAVIRLIDGTYFSWYGTRLLPAIRYFANLKF